ncbi:MAG: phosphatase PAP2 family protein [Candidatus Micrarchaeota archaeon]
MQDSVFAFVVVLLALLAVVLVKGKTSKASVVLSLAITALLVLLLKLLYAEPRPCAGLPWCDSDFGFPSMHSALSFSVAFSTFGTVYFYGFLLLAVLVALSRVASGLHSFPQVVAGMVLGVLVPMVVSLVLSKGVVFVNKWRK